MESLIENKMYTQRIKNIPVMRFCAFNCVYCAFQKFQKISKCERRRAGENHTHLEVLERTPLKTKPGEFITIGLSGDVSFMPVDDFYQVMDYCRKWKDRTFLIQSKNPAYFLRFQDEIAPLRIPDNVILGTTLETDADLFPGSDYFPYYCNISSAPLPRHRYTAMVELKSRKAVTIEPLLDFDLKIFTQWIKDIAPEFVYIGYANDKYEGKKFKLPEPALEKMMQFISELKRAGLEVREKTLRRAWDE